MAFQAPAAGQERANRRILEQLEEQKKRLRMQTSVPGQGTGSTSAVPASPQPSGAAPASASQSSAMDAHMTPAQRAALQHAHANSVGYFITQDSSFGNLILPVLPRLEK